MRKLVINLMLILLCVSCNSNSDSENKIDENIWLNYITNDTKIKNEFSKLYPDNEDGKVFKITISRRDNYVRVNIYQIKTLGLVLEDLPATMREINKNIFLLYDGSEIISDKISKDQLLKDLSKYKLTENLIVFNPKILQFDINLKKQITFNYPPVNPYDIEVLDTNNGEFPIIK